MERDTEKVSLPGIMESYLKVNGRKERKMDLEYGNLQREIIIKENGWTIDKLEKACTFILEDQSTRDNLNSFWSMEKENKSFQMEINIWVIIRMENLMERGSIFGKMEIHTKEGLRKAQDRDSAKWKTRKGKYMKVNSRTIWSTVKENNVFQRLDNNLRDFSKKEKDKGEQ